MVLSLKATSHRGLRSFPKLKNWDELQGEKNYPVVVGLIPVSGASSAGGSK